MFRLPQKLHRIHIRNKSLKWLSLAIAIMLYVVSRQPLTDVRFNGISLDTTGLNPDLVITEEPVRSVTVSLRGPRDAIRSITPNQLIVTADLSGKGAGERVIQLRPKEDVRGFEQNSIIVFSIDPSFVKYKIEHKERKIVPVIPDFKGILPKGLELYQMKTSPSDVEIEGPQSEINKITELKTEPINISGQKKSFRTSADLPTGFNLTKIITPVPVYIDFVIGERREIIRIDRVPVILKNKAGDFKLITTLVNLELYGPPSKLNKLTRDNVIVNAIINSSDKTFAKPEVILPESDVEVKSIFPNELRYTSTLDRTRPRSQDK